MLGSGADALRDHAGLFAVRPLIGRILADCVEAEDAYCQQKRCGEAGTCPAGSALPA